MDSMDSLLKSIGEYKGSRKEQYQQAVETILTLQKEKENDDNTSQFSGLLLKESESSVHRDYVSKLPLKVLLLIGSFFDEDQQVQQLLRLVSCCRLLRDQRLRSDAFYMHLVELVWSLADARRFAANVPSWSKMEWLQRLKYFVTDLGRASLITRVLQRDPRVHSLTLFPHHLESMDLVELIIQTESIHTISLAPRPQQSQPLSDDSARENDRRNSSGHGGGTIVRQAQHTSTTTSMQTAASFGLFTGFVGDDKLHQFLVGCQLNKYLMRDLWMAVGQCRTLRVLKLAFYDSYFASGGDSDDGCMEDLDAMVNALCCSESIESIVFTGPYPADRVNGPLVTRGLTAPTCHLTTLSLDRLPELQTLLDGLAVNRTIRHLRVRGLARLQTREFLALADLLRRNPDLALRTIAITYKHQHTAASLAAAADAAADGHDCLLEDTEEPLFPDAVADRDWIRLGQFARLRLFNVSIAPVDEEWATAPPVRLSADVKKRLTRACQRRTQENKPLSIKLGDNHF